MSNPFQYQSNSGSNPSQQYSKYNSNMSNMNTNVSNTPNLPNVNNSNMSGMSGMPNVNSNMYNKNMSTNSSGFDLNNLINDLVYKAPESVRKWANDFVNPQTYNRPMQGGQLSDNLTQMFGKQNWEQLWNNAPQYVKDWINKVYPNASSQTQSNNTNKSMSGGQMNDPYYEKYMKYKQKYMNLKNNQNY
jgi:hypothetical protein